MNMAKITVVFGVLLVLQGIGFYFGAASRSVTALIPAMVGLPILVLGWLAFRPALRKHVMHAAAAIGVLGLLAAVGRMATAGIRLSPAGVSVLLLAILCGGFVALCIKSFIDARRRQSAPGGRTVE